jgi:hypothetical protein
MTREADFSAATKDRIAERSGNVCAYPHCFAPTSGPALNSKNKVNIGEAAHIAAAQPNGPRFDPTMTQEERSDAENGIWLCATHAALIDRDVERYTTSVLQQWKMDAELRAMRMLGQPQGCATGRLASVSPTVRIGPDYRAYVNGSPIPFAPIFKPESEEQWGVTCFFSALVMEFSILKHPTKTITCVDHLLVTVHETRKIPEFKRAALAYPAFASLFYVELEKNIDGIPRRFRPTRYYEKANGDIPEKQSFPPKIVLDDNVPSSIAIRLNAKSPGMFLVSLDAEISSGMDRETMPVLPAQWLIFEEDKPFSGESDRS